MANAGVMGSIPGLERFHVWGDTKPVCHNYWSPHSLEPKHSERKLQTAAGEEPLLSKTRKRPHTATKTWCSQKLIDFKKVIKQKHGFSIYLSLCD